MGEISPENTLVSKVGERLRRMILSGQIQPGEPFPSRKKLAVQFGVGMSTVNEAVQTLIAVGLVQSRPGKGTWVRLDALQSAIHPKAIEARLGELDICQLLDARSVIEVALTEFAVERAEPEHVRAIWDALTAMEEALDDTGAFVEADLRFHLAVAQAAQNELLKEFYHLARRILSQTMTATLHQMGEKQTAIRLQRSIARAIEQRDLREARKAASAHLEHARSLLGA